MKSINNICILTVLIFLFSNIQAFCQDQIIRCDTIIIDSILNQNYKKFIGRKVKYFLLEDYVRSYETWLIKREPSMYPKGIEIYLNGNTWFTLYPKNKNFSSVIKKKETRDSKFNYIMETTIGLITFHQGTKRILKIPP